MVMVNLIKSIYLNHGRSFFYAWNKKLQVFLIGLQALAGSWSDAVLRTMFGVEV